MDDAKRRRILKQFRAQREEAKSVYGHDPLAHLDDSVDFPAYIASIKAQYGTPENLARQEAYREYQEETAAREARLYYERQTQRLSRFHTGAVVENCNPDLTPITTTKLQRDVIAQWDGSTSMFLLGETAIGKTYTATWCAMKRAKQGRSVASVTATRVCNATKDELDGYRNASLLVLDQLHTLRSPGGKDLPGWQVAPVVELIDYRYEDMSTTIGAGTVAPEAMVEILGADTKRRFPLRLSADSGTTRRG